MRHSSLLCTVVLPLVPDSDDQEVVSKFQEFRREALLMSGLHHPNICALRGICTNPFCLVTEFLPCGDLYNFIHKQKSFSWNLCIKIALGMNAPLFTGSLSLIRHARLPIWSPTDIAEGMSFLHSCTPPVIHRDLKTPNILMAAVQEDARVCAKVCDFGLSLRMAHSAAGREVGTRSS